jgi:hypothetical protein
MSISQRRDCLNSVPVDGRLRRRYLRYSRLGLRRFWRRLKPSRDLSGDLLNMESEVELSV